MGMQKYRRQYGDRRLRSISSSERPKTRSESADLLCADTPLDQHNEAAHRKTHKNRVRPTKRLQPLRFRGLPTREQRPPNIGCANEDRRLRMSRKTASLS